MTKSDYLSNSAKLLLVCSGLLFAVNSLVFFGMYSSALENVSSKLTNISFYVILALGFLAFNGEGIAYKHSRQRKYKKKTTLLKILLLSAFFIRFIKTPVWSWISGFDAESLGGALLRLGYGALNTVASYGFLLMIVALWYIFRDLKFKKLFIPQLLAFFSGVVYNSYRVFNYSVTKYGFTYFGNLFTSVFSNTVVLNVLCLVHFMFDIIMFALVLKHYNATAIDEQKEKTVITQKMVTSRKIYSTDCFGLDTAEDDFFLEKTAEVSEN